MKKILYIIAMLLAAATVLSVSGCTEKAQPTGNELQGTSENITSTEMTNMDSAAMTNTDSDSSKVVDVVCKMKVDKSVVDTSVYKGKTYYFCAPDCKKKFDENPEKYINSQNST
jgi:YHS domain-containing protein